MITRDAASAEEWQEIVSGCFVPLVCEPATATFRARMTHAALAPDLSISALATDGTRVERSERLAASAASDDLHLSLQRRSEGRVLQDGRVAAVRPGSVSVYATDLPYRQDYSHPGQGQLIIQISPRRLGVPASVVRDARHRLSAPSDDTARALFHYAEESLTATDADKRAIVLDDLAAAMVTGFAASTPALPHTPAGLLETMHEHIRAEFASPALTVESLAERHFISRRRVYELFEDAGETPADVIRAVRLDHAAAILRRGGAARPVVADVAGACGFTDTRTFARAFRRRFGVNPSAFAAAG